MDFQIWETAVVAWVNSVISVSPEKCLKQINNSILTDVIKKIELDFQDDPVEFLKNIYPNLLDCDSHELTTSLGCLSAATLLLIYVSFSKKTELQGLRDMMCTKLDNSTQLLIAEFLMSIQNHEDVFSISFKAVKQEIFSFIESHALHTPMIGDGIKTPVKNNISNTSFESPLQGFFQTPKRYQQRHIKSSSKMSGDGDHLKLIKKLTNQLVEEELEKASLQEQLNVYVKKCNENETKLRNKIEEINLLKCEWETESNKNEVEFKSLKNNIIKKLEDEKKLKNEVSHLEKYVCDLESELTKSRVEKDKLESQLKTTLENCLKNEVQVKEMSEMIMELKKTIENKEEELAHFREEYIKLYKDEKSIDLSFMDGSFDKSSSFCENMGMVVEKLLAEKVEENNLLKESVEELKNEKNSLINQMKVLNEQLAAKVSTLSELQFLNNELSTKVEQLDLAEQELWKAQKELTNSNAEIQTLMKENCDLNEKCHLLSLDLKEREQALSRFKNSTVLFQVSFIKLAEDFKTALQCLELEVENISKLAGENLTKLEKSSELPETEENKMEHVKGLADGKNTSLIHSSNPVDKMSKMGEVLRHFDSNHFEWSDSKISLQKSCARLNENIVVLKMKIKVLKDAKEKSVEAITELETLLKMSDEKITKVKYLNSCEIKILKEELEGKTIEIKKLENAVDELKGIKQSLIGENENLRKEVLKLEKENELYFCKGGDVTAAQKRGSTGLIPVQIQTGLDRRMEETREKQEFNDSLEEVPVCNKTFDIVNLEEKNINNKTFLIKKDLETKKTNNESGSAWVVSPPPKAPPVASHKEPVRAPKKRHSQAESSFFLPVSPSKSKNVSCSLNNLATKTRGAELGSSLTKASSLSSILEIDYSPTSGVESKSSCTSVFNSMDVNTLNKKDEHDQTPKKIKVKDFAVARPSEKTERSLRLEERSGDPLGGIFRSDNNLNKTYSYEDTISELRREVAQLTKERDRLKSTVLESEQKRKKDKETFEKNQDIIRQNIAMNYEAQLEHLKNEMKLLANKELAKHQNEQSKLVLDLREQNKRYKEHIDELRNQLWDLGEKLLQEQKLKRDLERKYKEMKMKLERLNLYRNSDMKSHNIEVYHAKESLGDEKMSAFRQMPNSTFPTMPTEDEDEIFDNRFLEDMKTGLCKVEKPEGRLMELQYRNSLCLPHLKSSYPGETQFHNPTLFKESDIKLGLLQFGQESQSLTDSDHSMTRSLLPENKGKKKEQTSYKRPGPPTPSKNGGRLSIQSGEMRLTPRSALKEVNDQHDRNKGTPNPLKGLLSRSAKSGNAGAKDENTAPVTARKKTKFFRKPFGARDH